MLDGELGLRLCAGEAPPLVHGVARMAALLFGGGRFDDLLDLIGPEPADRRLRAAWLMDRSWAWSLNFCPYQASELQRAALALHAVFRVRGGEGGTRLLALVAAGDLMVNAPLDFVTGPAGVRLDLAFVRPAGGLPAVVPDHDVAIVAVSESGPEALAVLQRWFGVWPRPILNDPARVLPMSRVWLPARLAGLPGLCAAAARMVTRAALAEGVSGEAYPVLLRPLGSHAGQGLARVACAADVAQFLAGTEADAFTLTQFVEYRGADGWYRKYRIAFVERRAFICHMAASEHWMVHYLNAGMAQSAEKRAAEAAAMAEFDGFVARHSVGLAALVEAIGLDYFSIDCAELADGRLLVFEADTAAIIHSLDSAELYPYKRPAMQLCYDAFGAMVRRRAAAVSRR